MEEPERSIVGGRLTKVGQFLLLAFADDGKFAHLCLGTFGHATCYSHDAFGHAACKAGRVETVVVLHHYATRLDLDVDLELGHLEFEQLLPYRLAAYGVFRKHTHLIGIGDGGTETIVGGDACKGIILVTQGLVEHFAGSAQEFADRHIIDRHAECQRVDKHTHGVGNLEVAASAADGAEIDVAVVGVARHHVGGGTEEQVCRRDALVAAEGCQSLVVGQTDLLADMTLVVGLRQVGRNLAGTFTGLQTFGKELLCLVECFAVGGLLLVVGKVEVGICLTFDLTAFEGIVELTNEEVGRTAIEDEVMHVHQQVDNVARLHHFKAVERCLLEVEGLDKLVLVGCQLLGLHLDDGHFGDDGFVDNLHDGIALGGETHAQLGMQTYDTLDTLHQFSGIGTGRIGEQVGDVVDGGGRVLEALEIDACLGVGKRSG